MVSEYNRVQAYLVHCNHRMLARGIHRNLAGGIHRNLDGGIRHILGRIQHRIHHRIHTFLGNLKDKFQIFIYNFDLSNNVRKLKAIFLKRRSPFISSNFQQ